MKINIKYNNSDYFIIVEPSCFTVVKLGTSEKTGKPTESSIGYFSNLSNAVKKIIQNEMCETNEVVSLKEYCERIELAYADLMKQTDL